MKVLRFPNSSAYRSLAHRKCLASLCIWSSLGRLSPCGTTKHGCTKRVLGKINWNKESCNTISSPLNRPSTLRSGYCVRFHNRLPVACSRDQLGSCPTCFPSQYNSYPFPLVFAFDSLIWFEYFRTRGVPQYSQAITSRFPVTSRFAPHLGHWATVKSNEKLGWVKAIIPHCDFIFLFYRIIIKRFYNHAYYK